MTIRNTFGISNVALIFQGYKSQLNDTAVIFGAVKGHSLEF